MNFVDYCIKTKNYSALKAVNSYKKMFSDEKEAPKELIVNNREANEGFGTLYKNKLKKTGANTLAAATVLGIPTLAGGLWLKHQLNHQPLSEYYGDDD